MYPKGYKINLTFQQTQGFSISWIGNPLLSLIFACSLQQCFQDHRYGIVANDQYRSST